MKGIMKRDERKKNNNNARNIQKSRHKSAFFGKIEFGDNNEIIWSESTENEHRCELRFPKYELYWLLKIITPFCSMETSQSLTNTVWQAFQNHQIK